MSKNTALAPILTDIVNMQLSKKDLIELLETEAETELENSLDIAMADLDDASKKFDHAKQKFSEFEKKQDSKLCSSLEKTLLSKLDKFQLDPEKIKVRCNAQWINLESKQARDANNHEIYINDLGYTHYYLKIITKGELRISVKITYDYDNIRIEANSEQKTIKAPADYLRKRLALCDDLINTCNKLEIERKKVKDIKEDIANIPKKIKKLSSGITRTALASSDKGKSILKLMNSLKRENQKAIQQ